jgi:hypothetical protein
MLPFMGDRNCGLGLVPLFVTLAACSSKETGTPPADFNGLYSVNVTSKDNGCQFTGWNPGDVSRNIGVQLSQSGDKVTSVVQGLQGTFLELWIGTKAASGTAIGGSVTLDSAGSLEHKDKDSACTFYVDSKMIGTLTGDALQGSITYSFVRTNGQCGAREGCKSVQDYSGTRPPK